MAGIHFQPELIGYNGQGAFRFWCQKVLPLVYDDSLSYYELLCKVVKYLNNTNEDVKLLGNSYLKLVEFVNGYFDNLDVTSEVNQKLDEMVESGELDDVIAAGVSAAAMQATEQQLPGVVAEQIDAVVAEQIDGSVAGQIGEAVDSAVADKIDDAVESQIDGAVAGQIDGTVAEQIGPAVLEQSGGLAAPAVTEWLEQNVVPQGSAVVVDESLKVQGAAADALYAGTGIRALENEFVWDNSSVEFEVGNINRNTGETETGTAIRTVGFIENAAEVKCNNGYALEVYAYNKNTNAFVGGYRGGSFAIGESGQDTVIGLPSYYKYKIALVRAGATTANPTTVSEKENAYFLIGTDTTLSLSNKAADAKAVGDALDELASRPGLTNEAKLALLNCFAHVAWIDEHGKDYYDALEAALCSTADLVSISAVFVQGQTVVYATDSLDVLKPMLTVTAHYSDETTKTVTAYTLSGALTEGTSTITVSYGGKTTTFDVTVSFSWDYNWDYTMGNPTEHGFSTTTTQSGSAVFVAGVGEKLSIPGGSASLHPSANYSAQHGLMELVVLPSRVSSTFQGLVIIGSNGTNGFRVRLYKNGLYYATLKNTEATDIKIADITEGQEYKFRFEWSSGVVDVKMDGAQIYHGELNSPQSQRVVVTQTGVGAESIIKEFRVTEVA